MNWWLILYNYNFLEGQLTPLQAYQVIRNCGTQLKYERPAKRIELAHYMWDKIVETGNYNSIYSVQYCSL